MHVLLIRHGEASDPRESTDAHRHLTLRGREASAEMAKALRRFDAVPTHLYTSPLVRAVQTAEIVAHAIGHPGPIVAHEALVPGGSIARALGVLAHHAPTDRVALVTHEPTVRTLAGQLSGLGGGFPGFRTSGAALFVLDSLGHGALVGRLDPSTLEWRDAGDLDP